MFTFIFVVGNSRIEAFLKLNQEISIGIVGIENEARPLIDLVSESVPLLLNLTSQPLERPCGLESS